MKKKLTFTILALLCLVTFLLSMYWGSYRINVSEIFAVFLGKGENYLLLCHEIWYNSTRWEALRGNYVY